MAQGVGHRKDKKMSGNHCHHHHYIIIIINPNNGFALALCAGQQT